MLWPLWCVMACGSVHGCEAIDRQAACLSFLQRSSELFIQQRKIKNAADFAFRSMQPRTHL